MKIFKIFYHYNLVYSQLIFCMWFNSWIWRKKEVFEKREIIGRPFPLEYPELEVFPVLADDICPNQKLKDVGIEYRFLNNELVAINFVALKW